MDTLGASNVLTLFTITPRGKIRNEEVIRSGGDKPDREALRLIRMMPDWQPARSNGKAVEAEYSLTISFKK
jgi:protein TonB